MGYEQIVLKILKQLSSEDRFILFILILFCLEKRCDKYLKLMLLIIFVSGFGQGFISKES